MCLKDILFGRHDYLVLSCLQFETRLMRWNTERLVDSAWGADSGDFSVRMKLFQYKDKRFMASVT